MHIERTRVTFWLDGVCSADLGIVVQGFPTFGGSAPRVTKYDVPGRTGDLLYWDGSYKNVDGEIKCYLADTEDVERAISAAASWMAVGGYHKLTLSNELGRYRMARITNAAEIAIKMGVLAPFTIKLDCKPQRFYEDDAPRIFGVSGTVVNELPFASAPLMRCMWASGASKAGTEEIKFVHGDKQCRALLSSPPAVPTYIDVDLEARCAVTSAGANVPIYFEGGYPLLKQGETTFTCSNSLAGTNWFSAVHLYPRWWTL